MSGTLATFDALWRERWGREAEPVGSLLRGRPTWTRFHSLPHSKRYAESASESAEVLKRHVTLIRSLAQENFTRLVVIASESRSDSGERPWVLGVFPDAVLWRKERVDDEGLGTPPLMVSFGPNTMRGITPALLSIANDEIESLTITDETLDWLYCPYDGGVDVFVRSSAESDRLRVAYQDWRPQNSMGL